MNFKEQVHQLIEAALNEHQDLFLIETSISDNNEIKVIIDGDNGVNIDAIVDISRKIEHNLDRDEHDFSLEVTSVDITKPFKLKRQFHKNLNKQIKVKTQEKTFEGNLVEMDEQQIILTYKTREPKKIGKGKQTVINRKEIAFDEIIEAKVVLKF